LAFVFLLWAPISAFYSEFVISKLELTQRELLSACTQQSVRKRNQRMSAGGSQGYYRVTTISKMEGKIAGWQTDIQRCQLLQLYHELLMLSI